MGATAKSPAYLVRRSGTWYFRITVPTELQNRLGRLEYRRSLGTGYLSEARPLAMKLGVGLVHLFNKIRDGFGMELTDTQLQELAEGWIKKNLDEWQEEHLNRKPLTDYELYDPEYEPPDLAGLEEWRHQAAEAIVRRDLSWISESVDEVIADKGLQIPKNSPAYRMLSLRLLLAEKECAEIALKRYFGDYSDRFFTSPSFPPSSSPPASDTCIIKLSEIMADWFARNPQWPEETTRKNYANFVGTFIEVVGDISIGDLTKDQVREYADVLAQLPAKRKTKKKYRDLSLDQLRAMKITENERLRPKTIKDSFTAVKAFLNWAVDNYNGVPANLGGPLSPPQSTADPSTAKAAFTKEDLHAIFHGPDYVQDSWDDKQAARFWLPLLMLFTGARNEEMAQLHLSDIHERDGVWVFDINDEEDKKIKRPSSRRIVPIHPELLDLGFMNYVDRIKRTGSPFLFPHLTRGKSSGKKSDTIGKWFNRTYKNKIGLEDGPEGIKVLYSFRHTFIDHCYTAGLNSDLWHIVVGHEAESLTQSDRHYVKARGNALLLFDEVISRVKFEVDLEHLKGSKWVR